MKKTNKILTILLVLASLLTACNPNTPATPVVEPTASLPLPTPIVSTETPPDIETAAVEYLELWKAENYPAMYELLSRLTKDAITPEEFEESHRDTAKKLTMKSMDYQILSSMPNLASGQVSYQLDYETNLLGTISRQPIMNLTLEDQRWHVQWDASMMLPELTNGNYLELVLEIPARGNIYANATSNNYALVSYEDAVTVMVTPGYIEEGTEDDMVELKSSCVPKTASEQSMPISAVFNTQLSAISWQMLPKLIMTASRLFLLLRWIATKRAIITTVELHRTF